MPKEIGNNVTTVLDFNVTEMLQLFMKWSSSILENKENIKELIEISPEANAMYMQIHHTAIEIQFYNRQYNDLVVRFSNLIKCLEIVYSAMGEKYEEQFSDVVPPPPASITCEFINKDNLH